MDAQNLLWLVSGVAVGFFFGRLAAVSAAGRSIHDAPPPLRAPRGDLRMGVSTQTVHVEVPEEVRELIRQGRKVDAIKRLREIEPRLGLEAAKHAVDAMSDVGR